MGTGEPTKAKGSGDRLKVDTPGSPGRGGDSLKVSAEFRGPRAGGDPMRPDVPSGSQADMIPPKESGRESRINRRA
jgi:hypothetical protein